MYGADERGMVVWLEVLERHLSQRGLVRGRVHEGKGLRDRLQGSRTKGSF